MPLSATPVRNAGSREKNYKLAVGRGLYLRVTRAGSKLWRFDCRFAGRRKTLALGGYPDVGLATARKRLSEARQLLAEGVDPRRARRESREAEQRLAAESSSPTGRAARLAAPTPSWRQEIPRCSTNIRKDIECRARSCACPPSSP